MAFVVAMVAMPTFYGVVVIDSHCSIAADICHPLQSVEVSPASLFAPPPQVFHAAEAVQLSRRGITLENDSSLNRLTDPPDTPPPEPLS
jgi:hypothetical protein